MQGNRKLGIVFTGGEGPKADMLRRLLNSLPEEPVIAAADSGLNLAEAAGLRPHWIIGDMDSLDDEMLRPYPAEMVIRHPAEKDNTDTELALALLWEKGCGNTWIIGGGGGRIDHLFGIRDLFEREPHPQRWITAAEDIYCIDGTAQNCRLSMTVKQGSIVSVFPLGGGPWKTESRGLKWALDSVRWKRGYNGLSNVATGPQIEISAKQGRFIIILELLCQQ
ncbi:MAG: thiamine diphosphokinase [Treponema sp.]|nr:thiamine diphosphokinase [Treponema sp.]